MKTVLLIGSIIGVLNSFILIAYALFSKKGNRSANRWFAAFIFVLTISVSKTILITFFKGTPDVILELGLAGFLSVGPAYWFFTRTVTDAKFKFQNQQVLHFLPAVIYVLAGSFMSDIQQDWQLWRVFYRGFLLQFISYLIPAIHHANFKMEDKPSVKKQLNIISAFLLVIWFAYLLNEVAGSPYISGAILYSVLIYVFLMITLNFGYIINLSNPKYKNTGLGNEENQRLLKALDTLLEQDRIYKQNTLSLAKLTKLLKTNTHALSQVINENKKMTFFELIGHYRIEEAKHLLKTAPELKVSEIAYEVGYNSLSAFNAAFKKSTGKTPTQFKNGKITS